MSQFITFYLISSMLNMFRTLIHPSSGHQVGLLFFNYHNYVRSNIHKTMCLTFDIYPLLLHGRQEQPIYIKINEEGSLINPMNCSTIVKGNGVCGQASVNVWN